MKRVLAMVLCVMIFFGKAELCKGQERPAESELFAKSAILMDADSGRILYEKNGHEAMANASTTKIMTCILALENCDTDAVVPISSRASAAPKVRLGVREGQEFYLRDLLYGLMLESFNDCAIAIAEYIGGSVEEFAVLMNDKAKSVGCEDTYFITPNGLDATDAYSFHHTTAADLAKIMRYCIKESPKVEQFLAITGTANYSFCELTKGTSYSCYNHNAFLTMMEGALSGKTGFTGNAGYCYVGSLIRDGRTYIVALLACGWPNNKTYKWSDTKKLMQYGIDHFSKIDLNDVEINTDCLKPIPVANGQTEKIGELSYASLKLEKEENTDTILIEDTEKIEVSYEVAKNMTAPVEANTLVGKVTVFIEDEILCEYSIKTAEGVDKINFSWCFHRVLDLVFA